ncbi:MAG: hypothetical protein MJZ23_01695 [Paludibacteraceae bacterium]|nr:hypothetical protein [Paludibacteraceae bacterium]
MKVEEVPQDLKFFQGTVVSDVCYAVDADGNYQAVLSKGWDVKADALQTVLDDIDEQCEPIRQQVLRHEVSPLAYHMEKNLMDIDMLADNSGIAKRKVKKHMEYDEFMKLGADVLQTYAETLRITVDELKTVPEK